MLKKMKAQVISLACIIMVSSIQPVFAQTATGAGTITQVTAGWNGDFFGIHTTAPVINPAGCGATDNYTASSADAGYNTYYAAALTAYSTGSQVYVIVSNTACVQGRPTIIGLTVAAP